jgi:hypothetical protein
MSFLHQIWKDLKDRKLLPVAAVLLVAIVAVPVALSSSSTAPAPAGAVAPPPPPAAGLPAVSETSVPSSSAPNGRARNPFAPSSGATSTATTTTTAATSTPVSGSTSGTGASTTSTSGSTSTSSTGGATTPTTPTTPSTGGQTPSVPPMIPVPKPRRVVPALKADQSYSVSLAITRRSGGLDTINPLGRLSLLPSPSQPLIVELGVLKGGNRVLFAVQPGTVVSGKGTCVPGAIDCEILSLAQAQTEKLSVRTDRGVVPVALFAVTGITAVNHSSHAAAMKARHQESRVGRRVLDHSSLNALSLFRYEPSVGSVVDFRNLTLRDS